MNDLPTPSIDPRTDSRLALKVPDSGRTWSVQYDDITRIPPDQMQLGDVLIVRRAGHSGVMFMQVTAPRKTAWKLENIELNLEGDG